MVFDNSKVVVRLNMRRYIVLLAYVIGVVVILFSGFFNREIFGYKKTFYAIIISVLYVLYVLYAFLRNYNYFSFNDEGDKIKFKFISLRPFDNKKKAIEIFKKDFAGFNVEKSFFNLNQHLILSIKTKKGIAKYPSISISALSDDHIKLLTNSLNQLI